ncbi:CDP-glycerol glycerophosphotransferase family protein [Sporichthya brevicatena]|uniref:CDP-glycerol glycerophosphotransferase family protein n=1 Tax=Sporichthya brevicatena TaxID=171442 RepID=A0ABP3S9E0_9ACTN
MDQGDNLFPRYRFSVVVAVYNVEQYLDEFLQSLDKQTFPRERYEVILVNDGSTDGSLAKLEAWARRNPEHTKVLSKPNGGQSSARNRGLNVAAGEWVTFPDPDDILDPAYLKRVDKFLTTNPEIYMVATNRINYIEKTGKTAPHPLARQFGNRNHVRDLTTDPDYFHGSAPAAFFLLDSLNETGLRFDEELRPRFEDGHFCSRYLLQRKRPIVGFASNAKYTYRKRADASSTLSKADLDPGRYTTVVERGYLDLLKTAQAKLGSVPGWLQTFVLYELWWYFDSEDRFTSAENAAHGEVADEFHRLLPQLLVHIDPDRISSFSFRPFKPDWRDALLHGYSDAPWHQDYVTVDWRDKQQGLVRVSFRYTGALPRVDYYVEGAPTEPVAAKSRSITYFERTLLFERIAWLPLGALRVSVNGRDLAIKLKDPASELRSAPRGWLTRHVPTGKPVVARDLLNPEQLRTDALVRLSQSAPVKRTFLDAWVLMDRITEADDSAEHLFRYLRRKHREINAWFVVDAASPDYERLRKTYHRRVVAHGSTTWKLLMLNCAHLISSHIDEPIVRPPEILPILPRPQWRFTFLQHGVIRDDISAWLNTKHIDLMITSTPAEHASVTGDPSPYRLTEKEVRMTGLPRFDLLRRAGEAWPGEKRNLVLVAPTWRNWLNPGSGPDGFQEAAAAFVKSEFAVEWRALLTAPELRDRAEKGNLEIGLLLHHNLQRLAPALDLPSYIKPLRFASGLTREHFARARVLVTDYSSMAFNGAFLLRPVVYFQFDHERVFAGGHLGRLGYFEYRRDGFGPVTTDRSSAIGAVCEALDRGPDPAPDYLGRMEAAFPMRDGQNRARVVAAIKESAQPYSS